MKYLLKLILLSMILLFVQCRREERENKYYEWREQYRIGEQGDTFTVAESEQYKFKQWFSVSPKNEFIIEIFKNNCLVYKSAYNYLGGNPGLCSEDPAQIDADLGLYIEIDEGAELSIFSSILFSGPEKSRCYPKIVARKFR